MKFYLPFPLCEGLREKIGRSRAEPERVLRNRILPGTRAGSASRWIINAGVTIILLHLRLLLFFIALRFPFDESWSMRRQSKRIPPALPEQRNPERSADVPNVSANRRRLNFRRKNSNDSNNRAKL